jgi:hypothetical protein
MSKSSQRFLLAEEFKDTRHDASAQPLNRRIRNGQQVYILVTDSQVSNRSFSDDIRASNSGLIYSAAWKTDGCAEDPPPRYELLAVCRQQDSNKRMEESKQLVEQMSVDPKDYCWKNADGRHVLSLGSDIAHNRWQFGRSWLLLNWDFTFLFYRPIPSARR